MNDTISFKKLLDFGLLKIVKKELIKDELIKVIERPNQDMQQLINKEWCQSNNIKTTNDLELWIKSNGLDEESWEKLICRMWLWEKWCMSTFKKSIKSYYLKRKSNLDKITYSLIRVKDKMLADELYLRIKNEENTFAEIATNYSEGVEKQTGGRIGPISINEPHPEISNLLKVTSLNELISPKPVEEWWVILKLERKFDAKLDNSLSKLLSLELGEKFLENKVCA